jgi:outer membrane protein assembly factor BamE (lipoprotein component of BamABCDE complex)
MLPARWTISIALCAVLLAACSPSKATVDNYKKLDWTMTREQVYKLLGKPSETTSRDTDSGGGTTVETWKGNDQDLITVTFVDGKVAMKSMRSDGKDY